MPTYVDLIKAHLLEKGSITSWESIKLYGNTRLSSTIHILRHKYGWKIISERIYTRRWWGLGKKTRWVKYILKGTNTNGK